MTLPDERYRAIKQTEHFLMDLLDPKKTPRVPKSIRQRVGSLLKHYPNQFHLDRLAEKSPDVIIKQMEPLTKMVVLYGEKKNDNAS